MALINVEKREINIKKIRRQEPRANILVYTEYVDSQQAVEKALAEASSDGVRLISGSAAESERARITERFRTQDTRILVSTEPEARLIAALMIVPSL